jgi:hypothetical protein
MGSKLQNDVFFKVAAMPNNANSGRWPIRQQFLLSLFCSQHDIVLFRAPQKLIADNYLEVETSWISLYYWGFEKEGRPYHASALLCQLLVLKKELDHWCSFFTHCVVIKETVT